MPEDRFSPQEVDNIVNCAKHVTNYRSDGGPCDAPAKEQNHDGIEDHIQEVSQKLPHHGLARLPLGADHVGVAVGDDDKEIPPRLTMVR